MKKEGGIYRVRNVWGASKEGGVWVCVCGVGEFGCEWDGCLGFKGVRTKFGVGLSVV